MSSASLSFARRDEHRVLAGVAGGFADQHGIDPLVVRGALVLLSFAAGVGVLLYAIGASVSAPAKTRMPPAHPRDMRRNASVALVAVGATLLVRSTGLWLGDALMLPLGVVIAGVVVMGVFRPDTVAGSAAARGFAPLGELTAGRHARTRLVAGAVLAAFGLVLVGTRGGVSVSVRVGAFATALTVVGIAVLLGPWLAGLAQEAAEERRQRIRSEEREAMATHLHDSVLQTLALIQRTADDPRRTVTLARQQERELRQWLFNAPSAAAETVAGAIHALAQDVEAAYDVKVDVVVVGDRLMSDGLAALAGATREACVNAAKHSGETEASLYVEVAPDAVEVFVRDRGRGFDPDDPAPDRHGIAQSIKARLERLGGTAQIESAPGEGTEVHLTMPVPVDVPG